MHFENRYWKISIELEDRFIKYFVFDKRDKTEESRQIKYEDVTNEYITKVEPAHVALQLLSVFMFIINMFIFINSNRNPYVWVIFGLLFVGTMVLSFKQRSKLKEIKLRNGTIKYLVDNKHDNYFNDIKLKRNDYLRSQYGNINWERSPEEEISKFEMLRDLGAISQSELELKTKEIKSK